MQTNTFLRISLIALLLSFAQFFHGCASKPKLPLVEYRNFTAEIDSISSDGLTVSEFRFLRQRHGRFFKNWLFDVLDFSKYQTNSDTMLTRYLDDFLSKNKPVFRAIRSHYNHYPTLHRNISDAIGRLETVVGKLPPMVVYSFFSQFSDYRVVEDSIGKQDVLAFSSEMFMNDTFPLYAALEVPEFYNRYCSTDYIPANLVWDYLKNTYSADIKSPNMLAEAILNGKIWYTMKQVFPDWDNWKLFGYSKPEWEQMVKEEGEIWRYYTANEVLFTTDFKKYSRFFAPGNHTFGAGIPPDCPPMIGAFTGFRIVESYCRNTGADVKALWKVQSAEDILKKSNYNPLR